MFENAVQPAESDKIRQIREVLRQSGFCEAATLRLLGTPVSLVPRQRSKLLPEFIRRTAHGTRLDTLTRLFTLNSPVSREAAAKAMTPVPLDDWERCGLVKVERDQVSALAEICQLGDVLAAADWPGLPGRDIDEVMGLAASSRALAQMTIRKRFDSALDLGTGCGVQAVLAARHSRSVTATDINPRAIRFARFNAALNGAENILFECGSLFDPAGDRKFDLIVCNPPFVVGPRLLYTHTATGERSDRLCERIVRNAPAYLAEGGYAQIICNWAQVGGETSEEHISKWLSSGCDAWILHSHAETAEEYARARSDENADDPGRAGQLYDEWMAYFERERIAAVNFGLITVRRSTKALNWVRYDEIPGAVGLCGRSIELGFLLRDFLDAHHEDGTLLETHVLPAPDLKFLKGQANGTNLGKTRIKLERGLTFSAALDPEVATFIGNCRENLTLGDYARRLSVRKHVPMAYLVPSFLVVVRHLIEFGFLLPTEILTKLDR